MPDDAFPLSPGERVDLRKQIGWLMADDPVSEVNLILEEFGLPFPDEWQEPKKALLLGLTSKASDDTLTELHKYLLTRDLSSHDPDNSPFDAKEQAEIAAWAADLEQNAAERYSLNDDQMKVLISEVRKLVKASGEVGRKEWYRAAVGAFVTIAIGRAIESPAAKEVIEGMISTLGHLFGHPIPQLGSGPLF